MKAYMLAQLAFWLQQVMVIFIEERRKDHWQMLSHHVITISLIVSCYCYHFTRVGNVILILMDPIDIIFPVSSSIALGFRSWLSIPPPPPLPQATLT